MNLSLRKLSSGQRCGISQVAGDAHALTLCAKWVWGAGEQSDAVSQTWIALFCPRLLSTGCHGAKMSAFKLLFFFAPHKHTLTRTHMHTHDHHSAHTVSPRLYHRILFCRASFNSLPARSRIQQSFNSNLHKLFNADIHDSQKSRGCAHIRAFPRCVFPPNCPTLSLDLLRLPPFSSCKSPKSRAGKHPQPPHATRLRFQSQIIRPTDTRLFLLRRRCLSPCFSRCRRIWIAGRCCYGSVRTERESVCKLFQYQSKGSIRLSVSPFGTRGSFTA